MYWIPLLVTIHFCDLMVISTEGAQNAYMPKEADQLQSSTLMGSFKQPIQINYNVFHVLNVKFLTNLIEDVNSFNITIVFLSYQGFDILEVSLPQTIIIITIIIRLTDIMTK